MIKERYLVSWVLCFCLFSLLGQAQEYQLVQTIETNARFFTTDKLQNVYLISSENEITKYDKNGLQLFRYNNNLLGDLSFVDAKNPFKLLLFYPDFANLIFLDRTMTSTGSFRLFDFNLIQIDAVALAADNNIWVYDKLDFQLKKIDHTGQVIARSGDLSLTLDTALSPTSLIEIEQQIYLNNPETGILVFDVFGQYEKTLAFKHLKDFQIINGKLLFYQTGKLQAFNLLSLLLQEVKLPNEIGDEAQLLMQKNRLYVLENETLKIFKF